MRRALCEPSGRVAQVEDKDFPVAPSLEWRDCADDVTPETHRFNGSDFELIPIRLEPVMPPPPTPTEQIISDPNQLAALKKALGM